MCSRWLLPCIWQRFPKTRDARRVTSCWVLCWPWKPVISEDPKWGGTCRLKLLDQQLNVIRKCTHVKCVPFARGGGGGPPLIPPEQAVVPAPGYLPQSCCSSGTLSPQLMMAEPLSLRPQPEGHFLPEAPSHLKGRPPPCISPLLCVACLLACITAHGNYMSPTDCRMVGCCASQANPSFTGHELPR